MQIKSNKKNKTNTNYKVFNAVLKEISDGSLKVVGAFGASDINAPEEKWERLNSRYFSRALNNAEVVIK